MYKLVALDMDGTFLTKEHTISEANRKWVNKAIDAGVTVMFSTGRGIQNISPYIEQMDLKSPIVAVNGGEVWGSPGILLKRTLMKNEWISQLAEMAKEFGVWYWSYAVDGLYNKENWTGNVEKHEWLKFGFATEDLERLKQVRDRLEDWGIFEITNSNLTNLELNPKGVSKASGIMEVCNLLGIKMQEVIAMGDSQNDMTMIKEAGLGIAMGNAQDAVKLAADTVTDTNEEDGVAKAIQKYIFGGAE
ncbi:Cof-type HAD-IIB family hydrolase [Paenibacillus senegalensis]|uniref:Cof-type HAD-IIB family hydrolase n=1 Tax=Paenibacillus senegalensis TaxID=1465766 RepID=UPI0021CBBD4C|nr:Cof-type HAD-IIB family hydrolase [Paenibacillus senegalensis]